MAVVIAGTMPWHEGEEKMHNLMRAPHDENPLASVLTPGAASLLQRSPLFVLGTLDESGRPWTTVWGGEPGIAGPVADSTIGARNVADTLYDPVVESLLGGREFGEVVKEEGDGRLISGLSIDLEKRKRAKFAGRMIAGSLEKMESSDSPAATSTSIGQAQLVVKITESLGLCPKYLNKKHITPATPEPKLISDSAQLPQAAVDMLDHIDTLFLSTTHQGFSMDTNIRGGPLGFVRVLSNDNTGAVLVYPEYSGNRLYQSLGNLQTTPRAGYVFPDFRTGNVLYATGDTQVLVGKDADRLLPKSNLAVKVTITASRYVENGLMFRGKPGDPSPYNPAVRYLPSEKATPGAQLSGNPSIPVTLTKKELITPTISRFRFKSLDPRDSLKWIPGQYATLSFQNELDMGYSHMRDDDPSSINDDYIRTFTVSSYPGKKLSASEFEIMARKKGNATSHLFRSSDRSGLELDLKGFDGEFRFKDSPEEGRIRPFVASGIGITPVIAQLPGINANQLRLFWSISLKDIALVAEVFEEFPELPNSTSLFVTGPEEVKERFSEAKQKKFEQVLQSGAKINRRRVAQSDLVVPGAETWYLCVGPELKALVLNWLAGNEVIYEDFNY